MAIQTTVNEENFDELSQKYFPPVLPLNCIYIEFERKYDNRHGDVYIARHRRDLDTTWQVRVPTAKFPGDTLVCAAQPHRYLNCFLAALFEWIEKYTFKLNSEQPGYTCKMRVVALGYHFAVLYPDYS